MCAVSFPVSFILRFLRVRIPLFSKHAAPAPLRLPHGYTLTRCYSRASLCDTHLVPMSIDIDMLHRAPRISFPAQGTYISVDTTSSGAGELKQLPKR